MMKINIFWGWGWRDKYGSLLTIASHPYDNLFINDEILIASNYILHFSFWNHLRRSLTEGEETSLFANLNNLTLSHFVLI